MTMVAKPPKTISLQQTSPIFDGLGITPSPFCFELYKRIVPIKANLPKGRDAKPWVYRHARRDHDSQVTEDEPPGIRGNDAEGLDARRSFHDI